MGQWGAVLVVEEGGRMNGSKGGLVSMDLVGHGNGERGGTNDCVI